MHSLSKYNKGIKYLLSAIDLFSKYALVITLKDKRGISIVSRNSLKRTKRVFLRGFWMYLTYHEGKSAVAERVIRTLKNMIFKCMTAVSKN